MLKVLLTVDVENLIGIKQGNPRWGFFDKIKGRINYLLSSLRYNKKGFAIVYSTLKRENFPASLMIVGSVFKPIPSSNLEFGYHSFNHLPLTLISDKELEKQVKNIYHLKSFTAPLWMIEDKNNLNRVFDILRKQGYRVVTYKGQDEGIECFHSLKLSKPIKKRGLILVYITRCFEGNSSEKYINNLLKDIQSNLDKDAVYSLSTHDFTHKNNKNLLRIIKFLKNLEKSKKIKIIKLGDLA